MTTFKYIEQVKNKRGVVVFSDPAGAKACLAIVKELNKENVLVISDRDYSFYNEFDLDVVSFFANSIYQSFELFNPEFVLTGTSFPEKIELDFIREANKRKIKTFSFVDHWVNIRKRFFSEREHVFPSQIWLIDDEAKEKALQDGIPEEKIKITGNPYYSYLKNWKPNISKENLYKELGLELSVNYILYAPEPLSTFSLEEKYGFDELSGLIHLEESLKKSNLTNVVILIKGHPNQKDRIFLNYIRENKTNTKYIKEHNINDLLYYSKIVAGYFSNSLVEANIMGKNVIRVLIDLKDSLLDPISNKGIGKVITTTNQLNSYIKEL